jgi:hypothetical protein
MPRAAVASITSGRYESEQRAIGWFRVGNERLFSTVARAEIGVRDHGNPCGASLILRMDVFLRAPRMGAGQVFVLRFSVRDVVRRIAALHRRHGSAHGNRV